MGRCSCGGGATCSCVVQGEGNIRVQGAGTSASPYVITSTGDYSANFTVRDTDTLNLSLTGDGSVNEPFELRGDVIARIQDLAGFVDPEGGPQNGEVPVWIVDHWEFQAPPTTPPGAITTGSGLIGDGSGGNPLQVAASGVWSSFPGFPADSTIGTPVYIDSAGTVRARPTPAVTHATQPMDFAAGWSAGVGNPPARWVQYGNIIQVHLVALRTGATIPGNSSGDITNVIIGTLKAEVPKPLVETACGIYGGPLRSVLIATGAGASVQLAALPPGQAFANGNYVFATATYVANTGLVIAG